MWQGHMATLSEEKKLVSGFLCALSANPSQLSKSGGI